MFHIPAQGDRKSQQNNPKAIFIYLLLKQEKKIKKKPNKAQIKNGIPPVTNPSKLIYKNFEDEKYVVKNKKTIHSTQYIIFPIQETRQTY